MAIALYRWIPPKFMNEILLRFTFVCWVLVLSLLLWVLVLISSLLDDSCLEESSPWFRGLMNSLEWFLCLWPSAKPPGIMGSHELAILCSWENPNPLWSFLGFSQFVNLLGEIFWGYVHGIVTKLSSKFHRIWTSFTQDLAFEALVSGCLEGTGLTGLWNRSDRSGFLNSSPTGLTGLC